MENLKLLRKVKKVSNRQRERELQVATSVRIPSYFNANRNYYYQDLDSDCISGEDHFSKLSDELILQIFKWIPRTLLLRYSVVCKRWKNLMFDESLWRTYDLSGKIVNAETLIKLLNKGVKIFGLNNCEMRASKKKIHEHISATSSLSTIRHFLAKKLSLESLQVDNATFTYLSVNKQVETLNLCQCEGITVEGLIMILKTLKRVKALNIGWTMLERESVVLLCKHLPSTLERFNLSGCKTTLLDSDIDNLVVSCPNLIELDLSDAQSLTSASVDKISERLDKLEYLAFSRCYSIFPSSYLKLNKLSRLVALDLFNILKDKSIDTLKSYIPSLLYVNRYPFSSIARPVSEINGKKAVWGYRVSDL